MNLVHLIGNLTADVEIKKTSNGKSYTHFNVAVDDGVDPSDKEKRRAQFIRCIAWEKQADALGAYCKKGSKISILGRIVNSSYQDAKTEVMKYSTDVVVSQIEFLSKSSSTQPEENIPR